LDYRWNIGAPPRINMMISICNLMVDYRNIKVPNEMVEEILNLIKKHKELGYRTHTEFIIEAIRKSLIDVEKFVKET
jgi:hypothetical protein